MANVSPGVYSKIVDLSNYVQEVPSTIGFISALTKKGEDNKLRFISSASDLLSEYGDPNINDFGKNYGQGLYCAYNFLLQSGALYFIRPLSDNAAYANLRINAYYDTGDSTCSVVLDYVDSVNASSQDELITALASSAPTYPLCILRPIGRGEYYNAIGVRLTAYSNPLTNGVYVLDIYERQSDGSEVIVESFDVSFNPLSLDTNGDSNWIVYVLETYSKLLRAEMTLANGDYSSGYDYLARVYDKDISVNVSIVETSGSATITDDKQYFTDWETTGGGNKTYVVIAKDSRGNKLWGWLGSASGTNKETIAVYNARTGGTQSWIGSTSTFDNTSDITYEIRKTATEVSSAFTSSTPVPLKKGTDGDLINSDGSVNTTEAVDLLAEAYAGTTDDDVLDTENIYFNLVFDCGYPTDVKTQIVSLCQTRKDCVGILDNGDNANYTASINSRTNSHTYNTYYVALYEEYNKVYDIFTGQSIWVSPIYHMSYLLPANDNVSEIWYAAAGFNRGAINSIKELRYSPKQAERDQMYLKQLNPIVKFRQGNTVWGQLTSQSKASAMQNLNIVRMVLYIDKALQEFCRYYIFEMNDQTTWSAVSKEISGFLESIKNKRGLYSYSVEVGATDYEKKRKKFHVNVTLDPTRVVEQIDLTFYIAG